MRDTLVLPLLGLLLLAGVPLAMVFHSGVEERADFVYDINTEPESIDTAIVTGQPGGRVAYCLFEGLMQRHPRTLEPIPAVAYRHELSEDGFTYTFHLRPCVWSNGDPVRASDFAYQWERILDPATGARYASILYPIQGAESYNRGETSDRTALGIAAIDDSTLVVTLGNPTAYFLDLVAFYPYFPAHPPTVERWGDDWIKPDHIVSNGPFVLDRWEMRRGIHMRKNQLYWDAEHVALETVSAVTIEHHTTAFNAYISGQVDWADSGAIPLFIIDEVTKRPDFHASPYLSTYFYRLNTTRPPFDDKRVRQALNMAMNKKDITDYILRAGQVPARTIVTPGLPAYESPPGLPHDPERARALLAEAGFPGGVGFPKFELMFNTSESHKQIAEVVQQQWKRELGIQCELVNQEWKVFLNTTRALEYDVSRASWIGDFLDPATFLDIWLPETGNNRTGWVHPEFEAIVRAATTETDPDNRLSLLHEAERILLDEAPIIPIYYYVATNLYDGDRWGGCDANLLNVIYPKYVYRQGIDHPHPILGAGELTRSAGTQ